MMMKAFMAAKSFSPSRGKSSGRRCSRLVRASSINLHRPNIFSASARASRHVSVIRWPLAGRFGKPDQMLRSPLTRFSTCSTNSRSPHWDSTSSSAMSNASLAISFIVTALAGSNRFWPLDLVACFNLPITSSREPLNKTSSVGFRPHS